MAVGVLGFFLLASRGEQVSGRGRREAPLQSVCGGAGPSGVVGEHTMTSSLVPRAYGSSDSEDDPAASPATQGKPALDIGLTVNNAADEAQDLSAIEFSIPQGSAVESFDAREALGTVSRTDKGFEETCMRYRAARTVAVQTDGKVPGVSSRVQKAKHHIHYLAKEAQRRGTETKTAAMKSRQASQSRYGW